MVRSSGRKHSKKRIKPVTTGRDGVSYKGDGRFVAPGWEVEHKGQNITNRINAALIPAGQDKTVQVGEESTNVARGPYKMWVHPRTHELVTECSVVRICTSRIYRGLRHDGDCVMLAKRSGRSWFYTLHGNTRILRAEDGVVDVRE